MTEEEHKRSLREGGRSSHTRTTWKSVPYGTKEEKERVAKERARSPKEKGEKEKERNGPQDGNQKEKEKEIKDQDSRQNDQRFVTSVTKRRHYTST